MNLPPILFFCVQEQLWLSCFARLCCMCREIIFFGLGWVGLTWITINTRLLDGFSSSFWKPHTVQVDYASPP